MSKLLTFSALLLAALPLAVLAADESTTTVIAVESPPEPSSTYWLRNREGWFWYRDPPASVKPPKAAPPPPSRPAELVEFEAMQQRLDELKRVAVMNPTDANLVAYMRYQRFVMNKSEVFAERWQRLVWTVPELDYGLTGRPTNAMAIGAFDEQQRDRQAQVVRSLAATHGLLFIFRSDCNYCHRLAPILKRFEQEFGMTVFPVSLDDRGLPEYPNPQPDNGIATRLNASVVPALYLTAPTKRQIRPVGFGVMAMTELVERIAALAQDPREDPL
jgi:conjugal transfer pilus assembly protein TraF